MRRFLQGESNPSRAGVRFQQVVHERIGVYGFTIVHQCLQFGFAFIGDGHPQEPMIAFAVFFEFDDAAHFSNQRSCGWR